MPSDLNNKIKKRKFTMHMYTATVFKSVSKVITHVYGEIKSFIAPFNVLGVMCNKQSSYFYLL